MCFSVKAPLNIVLFYKSGKSEAYSNNYILSDISAIFLINACQNGGFLTVSALIYGLGCKMIRLFGRGILFFWQYIYLKMRKLMGKLKQRAII